MREMTDEEITSKHKQVRGTNELKYPPSESQRKRTCGTSHDVVDDFASITAFDPKSILTESGLEESESDKSAPSEGDAVDLDELVRKIFDIIPSYYDKREASKIKRLIREFVERKYVIRE